MTDDRMALKAALEKASDAELLSHMLGFVAEKLMSLDVDTLCNASQKRTETHQDRLKRPKTHGSAPMPPKAHRFQAGKMCEVGQLHAGPYSPCGSTAQAAPAEELSDRWGDRALRAVAP
jgi:putative transposase